MGWAVAACASFYIGFRTATPNRGEPTGSARATHSDRAHQFDDHPWTGSTRSEQARAGAGAGEAAGPLKNIFGCYSLERVGLMALTEQAVTDPSPITRRLAFAKVLENMTPENALEIRARLVALDPDNQTWTEFNYAWGALAGRQAFDYAMQSDEPDLNAALMGWAAADPQAAMAALESLPAEIEGQRAQLEQNLIAGIADYDLNLATQMALKLSVDKDERQTRRLMRAVANEALRNGGPETASLWAASLPDGDTKGAAIRRVSEAYVRKDPVAAAAWAESFADKDYASAAIGEISEEWAESDATATVAWLETLPAGDAQNRGFAEALGEWEDRDPQAATAYLMAMERSPQRDAAIAGFARGYAWQDPQAAIAWAQDIGDPAMRNRALVRVGYAYHRRDPENARIWLQSSGLSEEQQRAAMTGRP